MTKMQKTEKEIKDRSKTGNESNEFVRKNIHTKKKDCGS